MEGERTRGRRDRGQRVTAYQWVHGYFLARQSILSPYVLLLTIFIHYGTILAVL